MPEPRAPAGRAGMQAPMCRRSSPRRSMRPLHELFFFCSSSFLFGAAAEPCDLTGQWTWMAVAGPWSNWPPTYNITHNLSSGAVRFPGFTTSLFVTTDRFAPRDNWAYATGQVRGTTLRLTLHGLQPPYHRASVNLSGVIGPGCQFIDVQGALSRCGSASAPPPMAGDAAVEQALHTHSRSADPLALDPVCSAVPGPTCITPAGQHVKCQVCKGNVCGCPGFTSSCKVCLFCEPCRAVSSVASPLAAPTLPLVDGGVCFGVVPQSIWCHLIGLNLSPVGCCVQLVCAALVAKPYA